MKSVFKLNDALKKRRLKNWICLILELAVCVGGFLWGYFEQREVFEKGVIGFALFMLIKEFRELEE